MPATCRVALGDGSACDILAVGRCRECGSPFCGSHQEIWHSKSGFDGLTTQLPQDRCVICAEGAQRARAEQLAEEAHAKELEEAQAAADLARLKSAIVDSPRTTWKPRRRHTGVRRQGMFGRYVDTFEDLPPAVSIGRFSTFVPYKDSMLEEQWEWGLTRAGELVCLHDSGSGVREGVPLPGRGSPWRPQRPGDTDRVLLPALRELAASLGIR